MRLRVFIAMVLSGAAWAQSNPVDPALEHWDKLQYGTTAKGSAYVPLDSWIYSAFARLIAFGYIDSSYAGLRPWTRVMCVNLLAEAERFLADAQNNGAAREIFNDLRREFARDYAEATANRVAPYAEVDSVYERSLGIAGTPINNSFHFGQTLVNDYGRPYQEGFNQLVGFNGWAEDGPFTLAVRGEWQSAPGRAAYPATVLDAIAIMDSNPVGQAAPVARTDTFRILTANLSVNLANHEISIGKSDMWWGPGEGGSFSYSNNAEPIYMMRINRVAPLIIPGLSKLLGPVRYDLFLGNLEGHVSPKSPWIQGQKISFKPSRNFEFGVSRTIVFAGEGHVPFTFGSFWNSFSSFTNVSQAVKFSAGDPGARYSFFDVFYRIPYIRDWLTLYTDSMVHDDVSPLSAPRRAAFRPGVFLSRLPKFDHVDFRAEAAYTDFPTSRSSGGKFFYYEDEYHDAYTNKQFILGDWIGREGKGGQVWLTYHLSPREMVQLAYRHAKSASDFVPGGTTQNDFSLKLTHRWMGGDLALFGQIEYWKAPILASGLREDTAIGVDFTFHPNWSWKK